MLSEVIKFGGERFDAVRAGGLSDGSCLESGEVAVEREFGLFEFVVQSGELSFALWLEASGAIECFRDRVLEDLGTAEDVDESPDDLLFELGSAEAFLVVSGPPYFGPLGRS